MLHNRERHHRKRRSWKIALVQFALVLGIVTGVSIGGFSIVLYYQLPEVHELQNVKLNEPLKIYTRDHKLISSIGEIKRTPVTYEEIPTQLINAFLAAEDSRFFQHAGIDFLSLTRAIWQYIMDSGQQTGASTITMQLARNFYLTRARTIWRKYREILLALKIERELTKQQIITLYLNKIFLGNKSYGIAAAATNYYSTNLDEISLSQMATLAGLPKAPSTFNPVVNPQRAKDRRDWILNRMLSLGYIDNQEHEAALTEDITPAPFWTRTDLDAQYVAEMARRQLIEGDLIVKGGADENFVYNSGLKVYTTIDSSLQLVANEAVVGGLMEYEERHGYKGVEKHFASFDRDPSDDSAFFLDEEKMLYAFRQMEELSDFGGQLPPALVHQVEAQSLSLWLTDGTEIVLDRDKGFPFSGIFLGINEVSPAGTFDLLFSPGDMVRVRKNLENDWVLAQVPQIQGSLSSVDPIDGAILAMVGGFYYYHSEYNRASQAQRLIGSTIKPLIYSYALNDGYRAGSVIMDAPLRFAPDNHWRPQNADLNFLGPITLRKALYRSRNVVSVRLLNELNIKKVIKFLDRFSLSDYYPPDLSLALGTLSTNSLKVAQAYSVFANGGHIPSSYLVERIEDHNGEVLYRANARGVCYKDIVSINFPEDKDPEDASSENDAANYEENNEIPSAFDDAVSSAAQVPSSTVTPLFSKEHSFRYCASASNRLKPDIDFDIVYIMNDILKGIARRGTARKVNQTFNRRDFGGKTGTTNENIDAWFTGVHPLLVTSVWTGYDNPKTLGRGETGSRAALPTWLHYTSKLEKLIPSATLIRPDNIVDAYIDPVSGDLVNENYPRAIQDIFRKDNLPPESKKIIIKTNSGTTSKVLERPEDIF